MPRIVNNQVSHTYGVLDPLMAERRDTKFFHGSLSDGENIIMLPQGGYTDRGGTTHRSRARFSIGAVTVTSGQITASNGGTKANLIDADEADVFTTNAVSGNPFVLFSIDFGAAQDVAFVDLAGFKCGTADRDACLKVQYSSDASAWSDLGDPQNLRKDETHSRRFGRDPVSGNVSARYWRAIVTGGSGPGTVTIAELRVWREKETRSTAKLLRFNRETTRYQLVASENNLDIFISGVWIAAAYLPLGSNFISRLKHEPAYDTILLFHQELEPWRIQRQGADNEWNFDAAPFETVPDVDYGDVYTNGVDAVQEIKFYNISEGESFALTLEGNQTTAISRGASGAATATNIENALEALSNVAAGLTVTNQSTSLFTVTFTGDGNAKRDWLEMSARALDEDGVVIVRTITEGRPGGEPIMSAARGWPAVGRYAQQRLLLAGFKASPQTFLLSVTGEPFNLDQDRAGATAGFSYDVDDDDINTIRDVFVSGTILFFTDNAVWHLGNTTLSAEEVPDLLKSDAPGIDPQARPLSLDNALFYVQRGGETLRQMVYSEVEKNFLADNASVLSAFLLKQPVEMVLRRATSGNDSDVIFLVNNDGSLTTATMMRTQDVSGFAPSAMEAGSFVSACVDADQDVWLLVDRTWYGEPTFLLERMDPDDLLDGAIEDTNDPASATIAGLDGYEGESLYVIGDDFPLGRFTVSGGAIVLPRAVTRWRAGFWRPAFATDQFFTLEDEAQRPLARKKRVFAAELSLQETTSVAVAVNGSDPVDVPLVFLDETPADTAPTETPFTGYRRIEGMPGFTDHAKLTVTQLRPGRLIVRGVRKEIRA